MMNQQDIEILKTSVEPRELKKLANKLAASDNREELGVLMQFLDNPDFLGRLDTPEDYEMSYSGLRLASVINVLMKNRAELAGQAIVHLINAGHFCAHLLRIQLLIQALSVVRPLPPPAIDYLNRFSIADSPLVFDVVQSLIINQSEPAMQLLEQKFSLLELPDNFQKISWMRQLFLPRRNDEAVLISCEKLLNQPLSDEFKSELVDVLFDYRPDDWYVGCDQPKPPPREAASVRARDILRRIGRMAPTIKTLKAEQQEKVKEVLESIK